MTDELARLIEQARGYRMTPEEAREQRISFAYGNCALENALVTREMVHEVERAIAEKRAELDRRIDMEMLKRGYWRPGFR